MLADIESYWDALRCFNAYDEEQQRCTIERGFLPFPWTPSPDGCRGAAEVEITTRWDTQPGPRFYCLDCARSYLDNEVNPDA